MSPKFQAWGVFIWLGKAALLFGKAGFTLLIIFQYTTRYFLKTVLHLAKTAPDARKAN